MKRFIRMISICIVILSFTLAISASNGSAPIITYPEENITVEFDANTSFTAEKRQIIADAIALDTPIVQSRAWCWLTGHDKTTETVTATYHKQRTLDPRCLLEIYLVTTCSKCDFYEEELHSSGYITCCPEEQTYQRSQAPRLGAFLFPAPNV